jgi:DNA-binding CsgD family transcriptional regulator/tetratricopeptide (TPR) repeat protein
MAAQRPPAFRGRSGEREVLDRLLESARGGRSAVLVIRGEAGVGKTALLRDTAGRASGFRITQVTGVESEMELAYAALHQLCVPMIDRLDDLPAPQQVALNVALGLAAGDPPDRFLVSLATLSLVAAIAEEQPLLCCVDDLQWLDRASAQVLGFVARRLLAEPVALVFGVREPSGEPQLADLPALRLEGLDEEDARALLATVIPGPIDERVRDRIVAETHGNPLALLELPHDISAAGLGGGFGVPGPATLTSSIEACFRRQLEPLPIGARRLLQLAAADPVGEPLLVWRAAERLGIDRQAAAVVQEAGLLEIGTQVRFRHPLVRSAAYRSASPMERHELHAALAHATNPDADPDRRAWHHAQSVLGPDEEVANELERSAARAQARGGISAAAAFLDSAATLTPEPVRRAQRMLVAARTMRDAGQLDMALERLVAVEAGSIGIREAAEVEHLRGQIAFDQRRLGDATRRLLRAARRLESVDAVAARTTYLEALGAAMWAGDLHQPGEMLAAGKAARHAPPAADPPNQVDLLLDAFAIRLTDGYAAAAPALRRALDTALALEPTTGNVGHWLWLNSSRAGGAVALELWDVDSAHTLADRQVQAARDTGALVQFQFALNFVSRIHILRGDLAAAASAIDEQRMIAEATGRPSIGYTEMILAAWRGHEAPALESIEREAKRAAAGGLGRVVIFADCMRALLYNGIGRYELARDVARRAFERAQLAYDSVVLAELAEAASRTGDLALIQAALERVSEYSRAAPGDWVLGIEARVRALAGGDEVERDYRDSIACLERARIRSELARSHLLFGEWLRREGRRVDAREQLRIAHEMLSAMGADAFAERARHELVATGERVRRRTDDTREDLTPQEQHIARLAVAGRTNPEIGAELFLSPRTVEWHLKKVFTKLGISSRRALRDALPQTLPA